MCRHEAFLKKHIHKSIEGYNPNKNREFFVVFDYMIVDILSTKKTLSNSD